MKINTQWLFRLYQEEAGNDGAPGGGGEEPQNADNQDNTPSGEQSERPDWLLDKYATEGRSIEEATSEQAKAYNELQGRFGAFTGSPDEYQVSLSDELKESGIELKADDPMIEQAMKFAKDSNMSQDGFNDMVNLYAMQQLAEAKAGEEYRAEQMKQLDNAESRIKNINEWANKNLDPQTVEGLQDVVNTAEGIKAIEQIIAKTRNAPVNVDEGQGNPGMTVEDVKAMQFEKDSNGQRRINTDPEFRARYHKARDAVYGTGEHRQMVG